MIVGVAPLTILLLTAAGATAPPTPDCGDRLYAQAVRQFEIGTGESIGKARVFVQQALSIFHEQMRNSREAEALYLLASTHSDQGQRKKASEITDQLLDLARVSGDRLIEAKGLVMRSAIAGRNGDIEEDLLFAQNARRTMQRWRGHVSSRGGCRRSSTISD